MRRSEPMTVDAAFALFTKPRRHQRTSAELALLADAERSFVRCGAEDLALFSWGEGPTVLMVHGWEGRGTQFHAFVPQLRERGFRAVAMDCPAHGDSTGTASSVPHFAEAVSAVAGTLGEVAAVIGHSSGAAGSIYACTRGLEVTSSVHLAGPCSFERGIERFCAAARLSEPDRAEFRRRVEDFIPVPLDDTDLAKLRLARPSGAGVARPRRQGGAVSRSRTPCGRVADGRAPADARRRAPAHPAKQRGRRSCRAAHLQ